VDGANEVDETVDGSRPLAVIDLDGVVADVRHRLHHLAGRRKNWPAFFAAARHDDVHPEGVAVVETLRRDHDIVYLTGRPEHLRADTERWLADHGLGGHDLVMRPAGDRRPAAVVKVELLRRLAAGRTVGVVVDDDPVVLEAMRRAGMPTFAAEWEARADAEDATLRQAQEDEGRT
jgi:hypothetical protein